MGSNEDVLQLNVGGRAGIAVFRRTLTQFEDSTLAAQFSGRWDNTLARDSEGNFFIDQDPDDFIELLSFLRQRSNRAPSLPSSHLPPSKPTISFLAMLSYYGLLQLLYPSTLYQLKGSTAPGSVEVDVIPNWTFNIRTAALATFRPHIHNVDLPLISVQVEIGDSPCTCLQMGYSFSERLLRESNAGVGITNTQNCTAREFSPECLVKGNRLACKIFTTPSTRIRIEWLVNGERVDEWNSSSSFAWFPCLAVKGTIGIVSIEVSKSPLESPTALSERCMVVSQAIKVVGETAEQALRNEDYGSNRTHVFEKSGELIMGLVQQFGSDASPAKAH